MKRVILRPLANTARDMSYVIGGMLGAELSPKLPPAWQIFAVVVVLAVLGAYLGGMASEQERRNE